MSPEYKARLDWAILGEFRSDQFIGEDRIRYEAESLKIIQQWECQLI